MSNPRSDDYLEQVAEARADEWRYVSRREEDAWEDEWEARHYA